MTFFEPKLHLSEHFSSIQGEGRTMGTPSIFWRFKGCPCSCAWCDTVEVWKKGTAYTFSELYALFSEAGYFTKLNRRSHHLIITGGDPLLQQDKIADFLEYCASRGEESNSWYIECENQATIMPRAAFSSWIALWNISPKLTNSGMTEEKRLNPEVMTHMVQSCESIFKFPVSHKMDLLEIEDYKKRFFIPPSRIWLMPVCSTRNDHAVVGAEVARLCELHGYKFSPRLQLVLWDKATGV